MSRRWIWTGHPGASPPAAPAAPDAPAAGRRPGMPGPATRATLGLARLAAALRRAAPPLLALAIGLLAVAPALAVPGILATHAAGDSPFLLQRVEQMSAALAAGHLPPRWMPDAAYGLGYPFWNYYAPLAYLVAAALSALGGGPIGALKVCQALTFLLAALGAYRLGFAAWGARGAGLVVAASYSLAPYHLVNLYVRGDALSELAAYALFPWLLLAVDRVLERRSAGAVAGLAMALALLLVSHNISALLFAPLLLAYALWRLLALAWRRPGAGSGPHPSPPALPASALVGARRAWLRLPAASLRLVLAAEHRLWRRRPRGAAAAALALAAGLALGLALAAWFVLPAAFLERDAVQLEANTSGYFHFANHFRDRDLVDPNLRFDFALDPERGAPTRSGLAQIALALLGAALAWRQVRRGAARRAALAFWLGAALLATLMISTLSRPLWEWLPLLPFAQFPWRWLAIQALALAMLSGPVGRAGPAGGLPAALAASALLGLATLPGLPVEALPVAALRAVDVASFELFTGNIGSTVRAEYLPKDVNPRPMSGIERVYGRPGLPRALPGASAVETATLIRREADRQVWQLRVTGSGQTVIAFPSYGFPGWQARIDGGAPQDTGTVPGSGWLTVTVDAGTCGGGRSCVVDLALGRSDARALAELVSLLALLIWIGLLWHDRRRPWGRHLALAFGATLLLVLLARAMPLGAERGPVTLDPWHTPYPHPNPEGLGFGPARLVEARWSTDHGAAGPGRLARLQPGRALSLELGWEGETEGLRVTADLVSPAEPIFAVPALLASATEPAGGAQAWVLDAPADAAPGPYFIRLSAATGGEPVEIRNAAGRSLGPAVYLGPIRILPAAPPAASGGALATMGEVDLVEGGTAERREGDERWLEVRLVWRAQRPLVVDYKTSLRLIDVGGNLTVQEDQLPFYGFHPPTAWPAGEPVVDRRWLRLPEDTAPGDDYRVEVLLYDALNPDEPLGRAELTNVAIP